MAELKYKNDKLEVKVKSLAAENVELKAENSELEEDVKIQNGKISVLERKLIGSQAYEDVCEENKQLKEERQQFLGRIEELEADKQMLSKQYAELEMMSKKIEQDAAIDTADLVSERENLDAMYRENEGLRKRLERAERYILNSIYEQFENRDGDNENGMV